MLLPRTAQRPPWASKGETKVHSRRFCPARLSALLPSLRGSVTSALRRASLSPGTFVCLLSPFLCVFMLLLWLAGSRYGGPLDPGSSSSWGAGVVVGPARSVAEWRLQAPSTVLATYTGWGSIYATALAQGPVLGLSATFDDQAAAHLVEVFRDTPSLRALVLHGIPPGALALARRVKAQLPHLHVALVYHGTMAAPFHVAESGLLMEALGAFESGVLDTLGVVKVGLVDTLNALGGGGPLLPPAASSASPQPLPPSSLQPRFTHQRSIATLPNFPYLLPVLPVDKHSARDGLLHLGLLVSSTDVHKNIATQLAAACSIPGAVVHVTALPDLAYLPLCRARLVVTGLLPHAQFLQEMVRMDVLLYASFTECFPMLLVEAMAAGIPVLVSRTHHILDEDPVLLQALLVEEPDSPDAIRERVLGAAARVAELRPRLLAHTACLHHRAVEAWGAVLSDVPVPLTTKAVLAATSVSCSGRLAAAAAAAAHLAAALSPSASPPSAASSTPSYRLAFLAPELPEGSPLTALALQLLQRGHGVTVIAHTPRAELDAWLRGLAAAGWTSGAGRALVAVCVEEVVVAQQQQQQQQQQARRGASALAAECSSPFVVLNRAAAAAAAVQHAYALAKFHALEVLDRGALAYVLLRRLHAALHSNSNSSGALPPLLPAHVPILIRLQGTVQLTQQLEEGLLPPSASNGVPACSKELGSGSVSSGSSSSSSTPPSLWQLLYHMERYALHAAHILLPPSAALQDLYQQAYGLPSERMVLAPPLAWSRAAAVGAAGISGSGASRAGGAVLMPDQPHQQLHLLLYLSASAPHRESSHGRAILEALVKVSTALPAGAALTLSLAGSGQWKWLLERLPHSIRAVQVGGGSSSSSSGPLAWGLGCHGALVVSAEEAFPAASLHRLAASGLPLVLPATPALLAHFGPRTAYTYAPGDAGSLAAALLELAGDSSQGGVPRVARLSAGDGVEPLLALAAAAVRGGQQGIPASTADTSMEVAAIERIVGSCGQRASRACAAEWGEGGGQEALH